MGGGGVRAVALGAVMILAVAACTSGGDASMVTTVPGPERSVGTTVASPGTGATTTLPPTTTTSTVPATTTTSTTRQDPNRAMDERCVGPVDAVPWTDTESVDVPVVGMLDDGTTIRAAVYPRPDYEGRLWSQWGQGIVLDDGRVLSAIGDHVGADGNSFFFIYDPAAHSLKRIGDVLSTVDHVPGDWGFGKIHAQMLEGPCDDVLVSTYWGTRSGLEFSEGYRGDVLLRIDPGAETLSQLGGVILDGYGVASMAATPDGSVLLAEAADPHDSEIGALVAINGYSGETLLVVEAPEIDGFRAMSVADDGRVYVTWAGDELAVYDPATNTLEPTGVRMPGAKMRASVHGEAGDPPIAVTQDPASFFRISDGPSVSEIGEARGYTTSMASPDMRRVWYIPDAHGGAWEHGTSIIEFDASTGSDRELLSLAPVVGEELNMRLGGTYNFLASDDGSQIYVGLNAGPPGEDESFGEVVFVVVELP